MKKWLFAAAAVLVLIGAFAIWMLSGDDHQEGEAPARLGADATSEVERGRELVTLADCKACHTRRGEAPFAGDRPIPTPFGTFYSPNITSDAETGIGNWSEDNFWRALHNGRAPDGRALYPAFPYTNYTRISRRDANAMFAYLKTIPPVRAVARKHELDFPYSSRVLLRAWQRLYFKPGVQAADPQKSAEWNRGAYLVEGLGHCDACHESRNSFGALVAQNSFSGGRIYGWYAPALDTPLESGLQDWNEADIVSLLQAGRTAQVSGTGNHASAMGPMAEVVFESLQHAAPDEMQAMAVYLKSLPRRATESAPKPSTAPTPEQLARLQRGEKTYSEHCARCHGEQGEGHTPAAIALAGNRAVNLRSTENLIRAVLYGGYPPSTARNPRPFGMPPFSQTLDDTQVAEVVSFIRSAWGNDGGPVRARDVAINRTGPLW
jgi:mono/diheme cytochrome c family protein